MVFGQVLHLLQHSRITYSCARRGAYRASVTSVTAGGFFRIPKNKAVPYIEIFSGCPKNKAAPMLRIFGHRDESRAVLIMRHTNGSRAGSKYRAQGTERSGTQRAAMPCYGRSPSRTYPSGALHGLRCDHAEGGLNV